jgi:hypothetical protein
MRRPPRNPWVDRLDMVVVNPATTVVCLMVLIAIAAGIGGRPFQQSTLGDLLRRPYRGTDHGMTGPTLYVVREGGQWQVHSPNDESWDAMTRRIAASPRDVFAVHLHTRRSASGLWAMTSRTLTAQALVIPMASARTLETAQQVRQSVRPSWGDAISNAEAEAVVQTGRSARTEILWLGYLINLLTLACIAGFVCSLAWVPRAFRLARRNRRRRALDRGRCPKCGYAIAGLPEPMCPECGELLLLDATPKQE